MDPEPQSRPVGGTEYSWCRALPGGTGVTVLALLLSRPLDHTLFQTSLHTLQTSHHLLRATLTTTPPHPTITIHATPHLQLLSRTAADTADLLSRTPNPDPFHALLEHELNLNPWSAQTDDPVPVFFPTVYELAEPGRFFLALRFHTGLCDRTSGVAILKELLGLMEGRGAFREEGLNLAVEDLISKKESWKPFWARGRDLVGYSLNSFRTSMIRFEDAVSSDRSSEVVRLVMSKPETGRLLNACRAKGIKLCGALLAAGLISVYSSKNLENHQYENYSVVTLIDCREYLDPVLTDHHVGFYHSAIINTHSIKGGEGLWELAMRCHESYSTAMSNKKHLTDIGDLNFLMCKAIENPQLTPSSSLRTAVLSVFKDPVIYESTETQQQLGVEDYVGCASVHGVGPSIAIFDTIRDGQLDCACVYPAPLHSRKQIEELVECMKKILVEGSHVGGEMDE